MSLKKLIQNSVLCTSVLLFLAALSPVSAQESNGAPVDIMATPQSMETVEISSQDATHPMLRLTPDKSELIRLEKDARSIIVGNPAHLNVLLDSTRTLILVPRVPGATHFSVLGDGGEVVMQRHVIIGSPKEKYIRIRRSCANASEGCAETSVYFCPDMCHNVNIMGEEAGTAGDSSGALSAGTTSNTDLSVGAIDVDANDDSGE